MLEKSATESSLEDVKGLLQSGNFGVAEEHLLEMQKDFPNHESVLYMLAVSQRYLKKYSAALKTLDQLKLLVPDHGRAYQETGHIYKATKDFDAALNAYSVAVTINSSLESSFRSQVEILRTTGRGNMIGRLEQQITFLRTLPKPLLMVVDLIAQGKLIKAEQLCKAFMIKNPRHVEGMRLLAEIGSKLNVLDDAEFLLESALELAPQNLKVHMDYIQVLRRRQKHERALAEAKLLFEKYPENIQCQSVFAIQSLQSADYEQALALFDSILSVLPNDPVTLTSRAHALKTLGQTEDAIESYRRAIAKYPAHGEAYYSLANLKLFKFTDSEIVSMETESTKDGVSHMNKVYLNFALGKAYEDKNLFEQSFMHYKQGNSFKLVQSRFNLDELNDEFSAQEKVFNPSFVAARGSRGFHAPDPIFIVGLPRAGSTLLEQILASHSQVDGTMELPNIITLVQSLRRGERLSSNNYYPQVLSDLSSDALLDFGKTYIKETAIHRGSAPFFIDKMPNNFAHVGLIHLMLPNAKIIDARRHPMGCCFSGFKQLFAEGQEFTYGLQEIGTYYRKYVELMDHWDQVFPNKVLRVQYEDVVADLDTQVRRILDYCELDFEKSCVSFYETDRAVRTPSSEQVRQPIYQSGVEQWKNFESNLDPLKQALGPVLERYPI